MDSQMDAELRNACLRRLRRLHRLRRAFQANRVESGSGSQVELLIDEIDPSTEEPARVWVYRQFYDPEDAQFLLEICQEQLPWTQFQHRFGTEARLTAMLGEPGVEHSYSGSKRPTEPWSGPEVVPAAEEIRELAELINSVFSAELNACLANRYRGKLDQIGYHSDTQIRPPNNFVFALSLGQTRPFYFKRLTDKKVLKFEIASGDLMLMEGATQKVFAHSVPKRTGQNVDWGERISLTWRELGKE